MPEKVYDIIERDFRKRRIRWDRVFTKGSMPIITDIMKILKNNKLTKYYNNIQQIYCGVTGVAPPTLTRKEEEKIIEMFQEVERTYRKYINRSNVFSYSYLLNKILRILKKEEHAKYFKSLKCRWNLRKKYVREWIGNLFIVIIWMEILNYDKKETIYNLKHLYNCRRDPSFWMLICGKIGCGKTYTVLHMLIKALIYYDTIYLY